MLIKPLITEKSTLAIKKKNCYTFITPPCYNKTQFKIELKKMYDIKIEYINSMNYNPIINNIKNKKNFLNKKKKKGNMKKFLVKLKVGSKIIFNSQENSDQISVMKDNDNKEI